MSLLTDLEDLAETGYADAVVAGEVQSKECFFKMLLLLKNAKSEQSTVSLRQHSRITNKENMLTVAYILSEYEHEDLFAGERLSQKAAIQRAATILGVKPNTLQNQRDYFDSYTGSHRVGWKAGLSFEQQAIFDSMRMLSKDEAIARGRSILTL